MKHDHERTVAATDEAASRLQDQTVPEGQAAEAPVQATRGNPLRPGMRLDDFVLLREIGKGGFAEVYLAHQTSLQRKVALKITRKPSRNEGQALAGLEHDHIVKVYSEFRDGASDNHGLVLQYVPGTNLSKIIKLLYGEGRKPHTGVEFLQAVDRLSGDEIGFDPGALRDRELLSHGDFVTGMCRLGARLAEALAFAHSRGILHCDIKPANILVNPYGRPMLVDFNVAVPAREAQGGGVPGGTLAYMAPEHLALFSRLEPGLTLKVDVRADIYSLGLVLWELLTGTPPSSLYASSGGGQFSVERVLDVKRKEVAVRADSDVQLPTPIRRVLRRCLDPDPSRRYQNASDLSQALTRAAELLDIRRRLPAGGRLGRMVWLHPILVLAVLTFGPHLAATIVNILYNSSQIPLSDEQKTVFGRVILAYNACVYPLALVFLVRLVGPLARALRNPADLALKSAAELDALRTRAMSFNFWGVVLALLGWLPGGVFFPFAIDRFAGPLDWTIYGHFLLSFTLSGLIAIIYSRFGIQFVLLRSLYPRLRHPEMERAAWMTELTTAGRLIGLFQFLAALVPLTGAVLLLVLAPAEMPLSFRLLATGLIGLGMLGLGGAVVVAQYLRNLVAILEGRPAGSGPGSTNFSG